MSTRPPMSAPRCCREKAPPLSTAGVIGWMRANLFDGWFNSMLTVISLLFIGWILQRFGAVDLVADLERARR